MLEIRRLSPKKDTLRELYLKSGNQCSFPECTRAILNNEGNLVGEVCHIEAAMPGGERFNLNQTNEERRAFSNLMLMCHDHHIETNKEDLYPVVVLQKIKKDHESKYGDPTDKLFSTISDLTLEQEFEYSTSLLKINIVLEWNNTPEMLSETVPLFNNLVDMLKTLSPSTRKIFTLMLQKSKATEINLDEISEVTGKSQSEIKKHIAILLKYNFITEPMQDDIGIYHSYFAEYQLWNMWEELKKYTLRAGISLDDLIFKMNFSLLD